MKRVLIVEDAPGLVLPLQLLLQDMHIAVDCAGNAQEATEACRKHTYDLILLDLALPAMNGADWLESMHGAWRGNMPIVLVLTNLTDESLHARCLRAGVRDYLTKCDLDLDDVRAVIEKIFDGRDEPTRGG